MTVRWWRRRARTSSGPVPTSKATSPFSRRGVLRRLIGGASLLLVLFQAGCYSYLPLQTEMPRSSDVRVVLNDRGRAEMSAGLGPLVEFVEGVVVAQDSVATRVNVTRVVYIRGGSSIWTGEEVVIPAIGIAGFQGRELSKARSWALAGATLGVVAFSIMNINLNLFGDGTPDRCTGTNCGPNDQ